MVGGLISLPLLRGPFLEVSKKQFTKYGWNQKGIQTTFKPNISFLNPQNNISQVSRYSSIPSSNFRMESKSYTEWHCTRFFPEDLMKILQNRTKSVTAASHIVPEEAIILINSPLPSNFKRFWNQAKIRICADGGANRLFDSTRHEETSNYIPDLIKGDLDSIRIEVREYYKKQGSQIILDTDQNTTDLQKCLNHLKSEIEGVLVVGGGGNLTQEFANINALFKNPEKKITIYSDTNLLFLLQPGVHLIHCPSSAKVGMIPLGGFCKNVTTNGLRWNLEATQLNFGGLVSSSNEMSQNQATVEVSHPLLWICDFRE